MQAKPNRILQKYIIVVLFSGVFSVILPDRVYAQFSVDSLRSMSLEELLNVNVISATKFHTTINEVPASVVIITRPEIKQYGYKTWQRSWRMYRVFIISGIIHR